MVISSPGVDRYVSVIWGSVTYLPDENVYPYTLYPEPESQYFVSYVAMGLCVDYSVSAEMLQKCWLYVFTASLVEFPQAEEEGGARESHHER